VAEAMPSTGAATITLGTAKQDWLGWGGTFNEAGWAALQALTAAEQAEVMQLLFSATDGIAFDWGRIPIGASDYAVDRYTLSSAAGQFDISRDEMRLIPYIKAAQAVKGDVRYWGSPWTPPPWAKKATSGTENPAPGNGGYDKGVFDPAFNQDYANYFVSWVQAYEMNEIHIDSVMAQNEPGWSQGYPTCAWGPAIDSTNNSQQVYWSEPVTLGPFIADFLKPALDAAGHGTKIWFGTLSNDATFDAYWNSLTDKSIVEGVALQWETIIRVPSMRQAGMVVMQSEHKCGNYPWLGTTAGSAEAADYNSFFPDYAPNNYNYGVESWGLIKDWINDGVSIYSAWNMVLDKGGFNLDQSRPWPQNALIWVDTAATPATYHVTPYYYVFRHVAQYVDPGAKVLTVDGDALAFQNPDGDKVIIIFNSGVSDAAHVVDMGGSLFDVTVPAGGWATVNIQGS
jgi:glucosylceramidase